MKQVTLFGKLPFWVRFGGERTSTAAPSELVEVRNSIIHQPFDASIDLCLCAVPISDLSVAHWLMGVAHTIQMGFSWVFSTLCDTYRLSSSKSAVPYNQPTAISAGLWYVMSVDHPIFPPGAQHCSQIHLNDSEYLCPVTSDMVSFLNLSTGFHEYFLAYCLNPASDDGCPYGFCPNPDIGGMHRNYNAL